MAEEKRKTVKLEKQKEYNGIAYPEVAPAPTGYAIVYFDCMIGKKTKIASCYVKKNTAIYDAYKRKLERNEPFKHRVIAII